MLEFTSESSSSQEYNCENHSIEIELSGSINIWCRVCIWLRFFGFPMRIDACCPFLGWGKRLDQRSVLQDMGFGQFTGEFDIRLKDSFKGKSLKSR